ncbi:hypothetical protein, partial [Salmonella enterica]
KYIEDLTQRVDGSVDGKTVYIIVTYHLTPPATLAEFPGLDVRAVITDSSLEQLVRQTAAKIPIGKFATFAICPIGKCISKTLITSYGGEWKIFNANYFKTLIEIHPEDNIITRDRFERPRPLKRLRLLID